MKRLVWLTLIVFSFLEVYAQKNYVKHVVFPSDATLNQKVDMASCLVPTSQQLEWQKLELTAFLHFGMNTFTGQEWGTGKEDPNLFNPTELDCEQWVKALKDGGFKMAIITAKHHDGFCLWPTKTTKHSVASSAWKDGKGDVVRELRDACSKYGMKFGVYLSPWDRNATCYGDSPAYNQFFIEQLTELLTNYGEVDEVWFDGANGEGPNGKKQVYDWNAIMATIRRLQPQAVTAIMGDDVRWVGNEGGLGRETEWSATVLRPSSYPITSFSQEIQVSATSKDLGSRNLLEKATELYWYPSEVDVSIRPGWFYHVEQDSQVRSVANLVDIYFQSVGRNSVLLLNIPPDRRGLIHETDVSRIRSFAEYREKTFSDDKVVKGAKLWKPVAGDSKVYQVKKGSVVNTVLIQEDIRHGQRVEEFLVEAWDNGRWIYVAGGTTIGYKRLLRFSDLCTEQIRVTIRSSRGKANICKVGLFYSENIVGQTVGWKLSDVQPDKWKVIGLDSTAVRMIDCNRETFWKADGLWPVVIDLGAKYDIAGFTYAPVEGDDLSGTIFKYSFYVSMDGTTWKKCIVDGEFSNIMHNPVPYYVRFGKKVEARYIKLVPLREINSRETTSVGEIGILL